MTWRSNAEIAQTVWGKMPQVAIDSLRDLTKRYSLRIASGDLLYLAGTWYITHAGLLRIAHRRRCVGNSSETGTANSVTPPAPMDV